MNKCHGCKTPIEDIFLSTAFCRCSILRWRERFFDTLELRWDMIVSFVRKKLHTDGFVGNLGRNIPRNLNVLAAAVSSYCNSTAAFSASDIESECASFQIFIKFARISRIMTERAVSVTDMAGLPGDGSSVATYAKHARSQPQILSAAIMIERKSFVGSYNIVIVYCTRRQVLNSRRL